MSAFNWNRSYCLSLFLKKWKHCVSCGSFAYFTLNFIKIRRGIVSNYYFFVNDKSRKFAVLPKCSLNIETLMDSVTFIWNQKPVQLSLWFSPCLQICYFGEWACIRKKRPLILVRIWRNTKERTLLSFKLTKKFKLNFQWKMFTQPVMSALRAATHETLKMWSDQISLCSSILNKCLVCGTFNIFIGSHPYSYISYIG